MDTLIQIDNPITVSELVDRWKDVKIDGVSFDFHTIIKMFKAGEFNIYQKVAPSPRNGKLGFKCEVISETMKDYMLFPDDGKDYILDLLEVKKYEVNNFKNIGSNVTVEDICSDIGITMDNLLDFVKNIKIYNNKFMSTISVNDNLLQVVYDPERTKGRIKELLDINDDICRENYKLKAENDRLRERVTELESARRTDGEAGGWLELYPMCEMIRTLHIAGESRDDIRLALMNKGYSNAQTAFLTQEDTNIRTDNAQKQAMKRVKSKMVGT